MNIRPEEPRDYRETEELTREAFWGFSSESCDEHFLAHKLRSAKAFIPQLDFVAEINGELAGNIMYSRARVVNGEKEHSVITFGPLSVLPKYQSLGVGSALMKHSLQVAKELGFNGIVFHGHPDYYPRFGFQNAKVFGITNSNGDNYDALMAMELQNGSFDSIKGKFFEDPLFECDKDEAMEFDKLFPKKDPAAVLPVELLTNELTPSAAKAIEQQKMPNLLYINRISGREMLKWEGIDEGVILQINKVLKSHGLPLKLLPDSDILVRSLLGIEALAN